MELLRARHARAGAGCTSVADRLNVFNGVLLVAHLDARFDRHLLTVGATRAAMLAPLISHEAKLRLGITESLNLLWDSPSHEAFLREHRGRFQPKPLTTARRPNPWRVRSAAWLHAAPPMTHAPCAGSGNPAYRHREPTTPAATA